MAGAWGTAFLNTLAGFFVVYAARRHADRSLVWFAGHRTWRLYGTFVVWSAMYFGARGVNYVLFHKKTELDWRWDLFFFGTTYHLWFLPYLLIVTLATLPLVRFALRSHAAMVGTAVCLVLAAMCLLLLPEPEMFTIGGRSAAPAFQIYSRFPGFLIGLAIGLWMLAGFRPNVQLRHALVCVAFIVLAMYLSLTTELPRHILNRLGATAAFIVALAPWQGPIARFLGGMGRLAFGVYLCHVLFVEGFISAASGAKLAPSFGLDMAIFLAALASSFAFVYGVRKTRWLAWLIP
jgi:surface polysaccharide O-acyltransferase-like enzyme